jgi:hypothetical protein
MRRMATIRHPPRVFEPLGCCLREVGRRAAGASTVTSLLAFHRFVSRAALENRLLGYSGLELQRALIARLRATPPLPRSS